jgi:hypothetical protein
MNLFFQSARSSEFSQFTPEQLGKLVTICLRWPSLLASAIQTPGLLRSLEEEATREYQQYRVTSAQGPSPLEAYWSAEPRLQALLLYGVVPPAPSSEAARCSLSELDLERYLQISPPVSNQRGQPETIVGFKIDQSATREDFTYGSAPTFSETQADENSPSGLNLRITRLDMTAICA